MTKKADSPSKTELARGTAKTPHWLHALKDYTWFLWSVSLCGLGSCMLWLTSDDTTGLFINLFGGLIEFFGILLWPVAVILWGIREWKRRKIEAVSVYEPRLDGIFVICLSAYALYQCGALTAYDSPVKYAQGDTSFVLSWLIAMVFFLIACAAGAYCQTHKSPEPVASEKEYQEYKRLVEAHRSQSGKGKEQ